MTMSTANGKQQISIPTNNGGDKRVSEAWKEWNETRDKFVGTFLSAQQIITNCQPFESMGEVKPTKKMETQETMKKLTKLQTSGADSDGSIPKNQERNDAKGKRGQTKKKVHIVFDAIMLTNQDSHIIPASTTGAPNKTVFLTNLPIDSTEEELLDLYSRCGPISNLQIYNRRPELDPGPFKLTEIRRRRKTTKLNYRHATNPTPVYAKVEFSTMEAYKVANNYHLSIFGMVIRKHSVRTVDGKSVNSLFVENLPEGFYSMDLEYKLSKALHPEIYVCLDVGHHDFSEPSSCEIKFPSFEIALFAYEQLKKVDFGSDDTIITWMRTPHDAMSYWTRELGYDTIVV